MSVCRFCSAPLAREPSRACAHCRDVLHLACWEQLERRGVKGCGHEMYVSDLAFLDRGRLLAVDGSGVARLWDLETGTDQAFRLAGEHARAVHAGGDVVALVGDTKVSVRQGPELAEQYLLETGGTYINTSAMAADGSRLVVVCGAQMRWCDLRQKRRAFEVLGTSAQEDISRVALSPDGTRVAFLLPGGALSVRDVELGFEMCSIKNVAEASPWRSSGSFDSLAFSQDGRRLLLADSAEVIALDSMTARPERCERTGIYISALHEGAEGRLWMVTGGTGQAVDVVEYDPAASPPARPPRSFQGFSLHIICARFLDETLVAVGGADGAVLVIDLATGKQRALLRGHRNSSWVSPDSEGRRLWHIERASALGCPDPDGFWLHDTDEEKLLLRSCDRGEVIGRIALPEGGVPIERVQGASSAYVASLGTSGLALSAPSSSSPDAPSEEGEGGEGGEAGEEGEAGEAGEAGEGSEAAPSAPPRVTPQRTTDTTSSFLFAGGKMFLCDPWSLVIEAFEAETGQPLWMLERPQWTPLPGRNLALAQDGSLLVATKPVGTSSSLFNMLRVDEAGGVRVLPGIACSISGSAELGMLTPDGAHLLFSRLFLPDDRRSQLGLFCLDEPAFVGALAGGHLTAIRAFAVSPLGTVLATCASDQTLRLWALPSGKPLASFHAGEPLASVRFGLDGVTVYARSEQDTLEAWDLTGLDARSDTFASLLRARADAGPRRKRALLRLAEAARERDPEALAAVLLFSSLHPSVPLDLELAPWLDACPSLDSDFDRRVRSAYAQARPALATAAD